MNCCRAIIDAILDPRLRRYQQTSPRFLILYQPGARFYQVGVRCLQLGSILLALTLGHLYFASQWSPYPVLATLITLSVGIFALATATERWIHTRKMTLTETSWEQLYKLLVDFRHDADLRFTLNHALDRSYAISNDIYTTIVPQICAQFIARKQRTHHVYPLSFLVPPHLACLSELGYHVQPEPRPSRPSQTRKHQPDWSPEFAPAA